MNTAIAFIIGMFLGGIVCFMIATCIVAEERDSREDMYDEYD